MVLVGLVLGVLGCDICNFAVICLGVAAYVCARYSAYYTYIIPQCMQVLAYKGEADRQMVPETELWGLVNKPQLLHWECSSATGTSKVDLYQCFLNSENY